MAFYRTRRYAPRYVPYEKRLPRRRRTSKTRSIGTQTRDVLNVIPKLSVPRNVLGFPSELVTTVKYSDIYALTSTANAMSARQYMRLNSINDPDQTGTGHQPLWHDTYAQIYGRYTVLKSRMVVNFQAYSNSIATTNPSGPIICGIAGDQDASISSTITVTLENSINRMITNNLGGKPEVTLTLDYDPMKDLGLPPTDDTVGSLMGSNPSAQWYGGIFVIETGPASPTTVTARVDVYYTVRLARIVDPSGS